MSVDLSADSSSPISRGTRAGALFVSFFSLSCYVESMAESDLCELHDVALFAGPEETEVLSRLARSPIGDECRRCPICRSAREYVGRRLDEKMGIALPPDQSGDAAWRKLQAAIQEARASIRRGT